MLFPTRVGMNRDPRDHLSQRPAVPHTRGDEPTLLTMSSTTIAVPHTRGDEPVSGTCRQRSAKLFPTRVGMNRMTFTTIRMATLFPTRVGMNRLRTVDHQRHATCSPHAWG